MKAAVPFGTPRPDGPSQPVVPVHRQVPPRLPSEPPATSYSAEVCAQGNDAGQEPADGAPAGARVAAISGAGVTCLRCAWWNRGPAMG